MVRSDNSNNNKQPATATSKRQETPIALDQITPHHITHFGASERANERTSKEARASER